MIAASTAPTLIGQPNTSLTTSATCRRESLYTPRQHRDVRLHPGPERRPRHAVWQLGERALSAPRAHQPVQAMLEHQRHDLRQLPLLMRDRITELLLAAIEPMPTLAWPCRVI